MWVARLARVQYSQMRRAGKGYLFLSGSVRCPLTDRLKCRSGLEPGMELVVREGREAERKESGSQGPSLDNLPQSQTPKHGGGTMEPGPSVQDARCLSASPTQRGACSDDN